MLLQMPSNLCFPLRSPYWSGTWACLFLYSKIQVAAFLFGFRLFRSPHQLRWWVESAMEFHFGSWPYRWACWYSAFSGLLGWQQKFIELGFWCMEPSLLTRLFGNGSRAVINALPWGCLLDLFWSEVVGSPRKPYFSWARDTLCNYPQSYVRFKMSVNYCG